MKKAAARRRRRNCRHAGRLALAADFSKGGFQPPLPGAPKPNAPILCGGKSDETKLYLPFLGCGFLDGGAGGARTALFFLRNFSMVALPLTELGTRTAAGLASL